MTTNRKMVPVKKNETEPILHDGLGLPGCCGRPCSAGYASMLPSHRAILDRAACTVVPIIDKSMYLERKTNKTFDLSSVFAA